MVYEVLWDHTDKSLIPQIFHEGFTFRGSLGQYTTDIARLKGVAGCRQPCHNLCLIRL